MLMSKAPSPVCRGFSTSLASRMAPAQVPKAGFTRTNCLSFSNPASPSSLRKVLDSPPGMMRPSISSNCSGFLSSTTSAPSSSSRLRWASKSPCRARTPIRALGGGWLLVVGCLDSILLDGSMAAEFQVHRALETAGKRMGHATISCSPKGRVSLAVVKFNYLLMSAKIPVGILGATGIVGQRFIQMLEHHPWFEVAWLAASDRSEGKPYAEAARWKLKTQIPSRVAEMRVSPATPEGAPKVIFAALDASIAAEMEPRFAEAGCAVVSNSSALRMQSDVPLVIPEVNSGHIKLIDIQRWRKNSGGFVVTNPN